MKPSSSELSSLKESEAIGSEAPESKVIESETLKSKAIKSTTLEEYSSASLFTASDTIRVRIQPINGGRSFEHRWALSAGKVR